MGFQAEQFQLVYFTGTAPVLSAGAMWQSAFGSPAPNFATPMQGITTASGPGRHTQFELQVQPSRIDLIGLPLASSNPAASAAPPSMVDVKAALFEARDAFSKLTSRANVTRVATVINAFQVAANAQDASKKIASLVPSLPYRANEEDVTYQVNLPRPAISGKSVQMNRLIRWLAGSKQSLTFQVGAAPGGQPHLSQPIPIVALYVDINSTIGSRVRSSSASGLLDECVQEAINLFENGYAAL